ncbi:MAG: succinyldiaminopimelate transaminase, partial [Gammaproteobacteria bacterium]|nr:succinyldiaminopimelate transaminase [Gammaproteobacteria bacterium]
MHEALAHLHPYPFEKLARLKNVTRAAQQKTPLDLSIGEPQHETPRLVLEAMAQHLPQMARYPTTRGTEEL